MAADPRDLETVDEFLAEPKTLKGGFPTWGPSIIQAEWAAAWAIIDSVGVERGTLRFKCLKSDPRRASVSLLLRKMMISRIDIVPSSICERNPPWASALQLEPLVCGPHHHRWEDNRAWISGNGIGRLPARTGLPRVRRLSQAVAHLCYYARITLEPDQMGFETKSDGLLFDPRVDDDFDL